MKPHVRCLYGMSILVAATHLCGCGSVGKQSAFFYTQSNLGINVDNQPPVAEFSISRKEGVIAPAFEGGQTPPLLANFQSDSSMLIGNIFSDNRSTFAGGDAAMYLAQRNPAQAETSTNKAAASPPQIHDSSIPLSVPPYETVEHAQWNAMQGRYYSSQDFRQLLRSGEVRPLVFGTDTTIGLKTSIDQPGQFKLGYNRKEVAIAPTTLERVNDSNNAAKPYRLKMVSFLAQGTLDAKKKTNAIGQAGSSTGLGWRQFIATGQSATELAKDRDVRNDTWRQIDPAFVRLQLNELAEVISGFDTNGLLAYVQKIGKEELAGKPASEVVAAVEQDSTKVGTYLAVAKGIDKNSETKREHTQTTNQIFEVTKTVDAIFKGLTNMMTMARNIENQTQDLRSPANGLQSKPSKDDIKKLEDSLASLATKLGPVLSAPPNALSAQQINSFKAQLEDAVRKLDEIKGKLPAQQK